MSKKTKHAEPKPTMTPEQKEEKRQESDKSQAGSFRRLAKAYREATVWDNHTIAEWLDAEADFLDPKHAKEEPEPEKPAA